MIKKVRLTNQIGFYTKDEIVTFRQNPRIGFGHLCRHCDPLGSKRTPILLNGLTFRNGIVLLLERFHSLFKWTECLI